MNIKKILRSKIQVTPSKDFDEKFWNRFEKEFEKEHRRFSLWSIWGVGGAVAALLILLAILPQFSSNFHNKEYLAFSKVEAQELASTVADALIDTNSYLLDDLDIEELLDDDDKIADTY